jgi:hypothetical protein
MTEALACMATCPLCLTCRPSNGITEISCKASSKQIVTNGGTPETTYYFYDSSGNRVRKVTEDYAPSNERITRRNERLYIGGFEVYREYMPDGSVALERESLSLLDDQQRLAIVETRTVGTTGRLRNSFATRSAINLEVLPSSSIKKRN